MITIATWYSDVDWLDAFGQIIWRELRANEPYKRLMGNGEWRTFDEPLISAQDIQPSMCPFTAIYQAGMTLGRLCPGTPDKETVTFGVRLAQATDRMADIRRHVLTFRSALYDARNAIWDAREGSLGEIAFQNVVCTRYPGPDTAPRPIWVADLNLVAWFPPPMV